MSALRSTALMVVLSLSACVRPGGVTPTCGPLDHLELTIEAGTTPALAWTPHCDLGWVHFGRHDMQQIVWHIETRDSSNSLTQPVRYGELPGGAMELSPLVSLQAGIEYTVSVGRFFDTDRGRVIVQMAQVKFRQ